MEFDKLGMYVSFFIGTNKSPAKMAKIAVDESGVENRECITSKCFCINLKCAWYEIKLDFEN